MAQQCFVAHGHSNLGQWYSKGLYCFGADEQINETQRRGLAKQPIARAWFGQAMSARVLQCIDRMVSSALAEH